MCKTLPFEFCNFRMGNYTLVHCESRLIVFSNWLWFLANQIMNYIICNIANFIGIIKHIPLKISSWGSFNDYVDQMRLNIPIFVHVQSLKYPHRGMYLYVVKKKHDYVHVVIECPLDLGIEKNKEQRDNFTHFRLWLDFCYHMLLINIWYHCSS